MRGVRELVASSCNGVGGLVIAGGERSSVRSMAADSSASAGGSLEPRKPAARQSASKQCWTRQRRPGRRSARSEMPLLRWKR
eukprot:scaffold9230_cov51-Phaeocystis_antarctica.AAC.1